MPRAPPSGRTVEHRLMGWLFLQGHEGFLPCYFYVSCSGPSFSPLVSCPAPLVTEEAGGAQGQEAESGRAGGGGARRASVQWCARRETRRSAAFVSRRLWTVSEERV